MELCRVRGCEVNHIDINGLVEELDKPFTEKEIKNAIDQMLTNKAPGPDGIPIEFHQTCLLMSQSHICFLSVLLPYICGVWLVLPLERVLVLFVLLSSFIGLLIFSPLGQICMLWVLLRFARLCGKPGTGRVLRKKLSPLQWS